MTPKRIKGAAHDFFAFFFFSDQEKRPIKDKVLDQMRANPTETLKLIEGIK